MFCKRYRWLLQYGFIEHCACFTRMRIVHVHLAARTDASISTYRFRKICYMMLHAGGYIDMHNGFIFVTPNLHGSYIQNPDTVKIIDHAELECSVLKITHFAGPWVQILGPSSLCCTTWLHDLMEGRAC